MTLSHSIARPDRVLIPCPDWAQPAGGVRKLYRHVDVLNAHGIAAFIVHSQRGFRCPWFESGTPILYRADVWPPRASEMLVVTEGIAWQMVLGTPGVPKVVFNQNAYQTFMGATAELQNPISPYLHPDCLATIVVSEDSRHYLHHVFPNHPVFRVHNSVDPALFHYEAGKKPRILFMPRKKKDDAMQVLNILQYRGTLGGFEVLSLVNSTEVQTAQILRESMVFLSLSTYEGSPMPPLEALACGCITIGYQGRGGAEYLNAENAFPIDAEDIVGFATKLEEILAALRENPQPLLEKGRRAAEWIAQNYSPQREESDILAAWEQILKLYSNKAGKP